jgi:hypothetical protein
MASTLIRVRGLVRCSLNRSPPRSRPGASSAQPSLVRADPGKQGTGPRDRGLVLAFSRPMSLDLTVADGYG